MRVSQRDDFFCLDRVKIAPGAPALVGLRIVVIAVRTTLPSTPATSTATVHTPAGSATSVTQQQTLSVMVIWVMMPLLVWRYVRASIDASRPPIWNAAGTRAALTPAIEAQLRRGRLSVDNDILQIKQSSAQMGIAVAQRG
jgi:hypothetical protein